jgi:hypothetical protein
MAAKIKAEALNWLGGAALGLIIVGLPLLMDFLKRG